MRKNLLFQMFALLTIMSLTLTSCDLNIFGKEKKFNKGKDKLSKAAEKAAGDVANAFDPNDPAYQGLSDEEIKAKEVENNLFQEVMEMQDNAMGKLSDLKKMQRNLEDVKGSASSTGGGDNKEAAYSVTTSSSKGTYKCPFAEERAAMAAAGGSSGGNRQVSSAIKKLQKAENSLYSFMNNFNKPVDIPHEEVVEYFEEEKSKISEIKDEVEQSMESGEAVLQTFE